MTRFDSAKPDLGLTLPPSRTTAAPAVAAAEKLSDDELVELAKSVAEADRNLYLEELYGRYYAQVTRWCGRICGNRVDAADLAQEVFQRVHSRLHTFRGDSRFSTWLYTVARSVAINRGRSAQRRQEHELPTLANAPEPAGHNRPADDELIRKERIAQWRKVLDRHLTKLEAKVLYLHFVDDLTLAAVTKVLGLSNKSGAKAYVVSAKRKLHRRLGRTRTKALQTLASRALTSQRLSPASPALEPLANWAKYSVS